ncbi:MAG: phosphoribosyltransferase [Candidatus Humimicrobiaceae bacterium]
MHFRDRTEAGKLLAQALTAYKGSDSAVFALPRGGVMVAIEIARFLNAPLGLVITRKIGHPLQPEYAIAATSESGKVLGSSRELKSVDQNWLNSEIEKQRLEAKRRREEYIGNKKEIDAKNKNAILVDDGIATGFTIRVAIQELRQMKPKKIIVAVPVAAKTIADVIEKEADELVALEIPEDYEFLGAVGAYYDNFYPVSDQEVISVLKKHNIS